ncbi:unnamed protein product [Rhizopus stolonifer]
MYKIRCDGLQPSCTNCQRTGRMCQFVQKKRLAFLEEKYAMQSSSDDLLPRKIVYHLIDIFFKHINAFIPFVHRASLKRSVQDNTISRPLLYSVMAISARFSDNPSILTEPPYLAGEEYAKKALSLVDASTLQPSMTNIQFWGIMSCIEYGRSSGSKCWTYATMAIRFCQELGYHKEEILSTTIIAPDGSVDVVTMALRRRIFWSCFLLDKYSSAGTRRLQCFDPKDCNAHSSNVAETILLRDPEMHQNINGQFLQEDSLLNITQYYVTCIEKFAQINQKMQHLSPNSTGWPPLAEYRHLSRQLFCWKENLPENFRFRPENLVHHQRSASTQQLAVWLNTHATWCSSMMILHRGSLAYIDRDLPEDQSRRVVESVKICHDCVQSATEIFCAMKDVCKQALLPYTSYSAYTFATLLMNPAFSNTPEDYEKSKRSLQILYDLIMGLAPYWLTCEKMANTMQELIITHQKNYGPFQPVVTIQTLNYPTDIDFSNVDFNSIDFLSDMDLFGQVVMNNKV